MIRPSRYSAACIFAKAEHADGGEALAMFQPILSNTCSTTAHDAGSGQ
jgi:hypothetical protein